MCKLTSSMDHKSLQIFTSMKIRRENNLLILHRSITGLCRGCTAIQAKATFKHNALIVSRGPSRPCKSSDENALLELFPPELNMKMRRETRFDPESIQRPNKLLSNF